MRAILCRRYGSPDVLTCEETEKPEAGDGQVLIAVRAASVNPLDWHTMRGEPYPFRLASGLGKPKERRVGADVAGRVEAVGRSVTRLKPGDEVFGISRGAFAEYACTAEPNLAAKPAGLTFEQAAAVPVAGFTALQGLRDKGRVQPGQKVLINGAAGGVGTFAVQIAKVLGAEVTGVCGTRNVDLVRSIGADHAVDYTREDFTASSRRYDVMLDCIGNRSLSSCRRILTREGIYVAIGARTGRWLAPVPRFLAMLVVSRFVSQRLAPMVAKVNAEDLGILRGYLDAGRITPVIDRRYGLAQAAEAFRYLEAGHARGKVVLTIGGV